MPFIGSRQFAKPLVQMKLCHSTPKRDAFPRGLYNVAAYEITRFEIYCHCHRNGWLGLYLAFRGQGIVGWRRWMQCVARASFRFWVGLLIMFFRIKGAASLAYRAASRSKRHTSLWLAFKATICGLRDEQSYSAFRGNSCGLM